MIVRSSIFALATAAAHICAAPGSARADGGELLWEDRFDNAGGADFAVWDAIAAADGGVFVLGAVQSAAGDFDFLVRGYDARTGELIWDDQIDAAGGDDLPIGLTAHGRRVFVLGALARETGSRAPVIRTYDAKTGKLLWQDEVNALGNTFGRAAAAGRRVFAVGGAVTGTADGDWLVRAYDAKRGLLLWEDRFGAGRFDRALGVATARARVFVAGRVRIAPTTPGVLSLPAVRAYDARTGQVLWQDFGIVPGFDTISAQLNSIAVSGRTVIATGSLFAITGIPPRSHTDWLIRAYDAESGAPLWQDIVDKGGAEHPEVAFDLAVLGKRAFVAGSGGSGCNPLVASPDNCDFIVRAYDVRNGRLLWEEQLDLAPADLPLSIAAEDGLVFAVGWGGNNCNAAETANCDMLVRAYEAETGQLVWDDQADVTGVDDSGDAVAVHDGRVFVSGTTDIFVQDDLIVRAYDAGDDDDDDDYDDDHGR
jgi:glucose dehydrogenase